MQKYGFFWNFFLILQESRRIKKILAAFSSANQA